MGQSIKDILWGETLYRLPEPGEADNPNAPIQMGASALALRLRALAGNGFHYLGSPYTRYPAALGGMTGAFNDIAATTALLLRANIPAFSPIAHFHPVATQGGLDGADLNIWLPANKPFIEAGRTLVVATLPGWDESTGLRHEIMDFRKAGKMVYFLDPLWLGKKLGFDAVKTGAFPADAHVHTPTNSAHSIAVPRTNDVYEIGARFKALGELRNPLVSETSVIGLRGRLHAVKPVYKPA